MTGSGKRDPKPSGAPERTQGPITRWPRGWESSVSPGSEIQGSRMHGPSGAEASRCYRRGRSGNSSGGPAVEPRRSGGAVPVPAGLRVVGLEDRSLEGPGRTTPLYSFEGSLFQCFPRGNKPAQKKKKIKLLFALQNCAHRVLGQKLSLTLTFIPPNAAETGTFQAGGSTPKDLPVKSPSAARAPPEPRFPWPR